MMDGGVKQRPLQTRVTKWSLFFFLILISMDTVDQSAESGPQPGPWEGLLCVGHMARAHLCCCQLLAGWKVLLARASACV